MRGFFAADFFAAVRCFGAALFFALGLGFVFGLAFFARARWVFAAGFLRAMDYANLHHFSRSNMPSWYSTISPVTADAATVSGDAKNSLPGPDRPL